MAPDKMMPLSDRIAAQSQWPDRLRKLLGEYSEIPIRDMGFPTYVEENPNWELEGWRA